jgi:predicted nucleic acid-binding Zn ribbon protein
MPSDTTKTNDVIRISKGGGAYAAGVKKEFVDAYRRAAVANDRADMTRIRQQVREHNIDAKGTGFEIKDFDLAVKKAAREAMSSSSVRYLRTVPKGMKQDVIDLLNIYGLEVKDGRVQ